MAFPYVFSSNFEAGSNAEWDLETDTGSILDFPHYTELARYPWASATPYRGSYCARIKQSGTADATLTEGDIDISDGGTAYFRWYMNFLPDFTATADDTVNFFELQQAGGTIEQTMGFRVVAATGAINLGIGDGIAPTSFDTEALTRNEWHCIELLSTISTAAAGAMTLWVDGRQAAALTSLTQAAAVGQGVLGTQAALGTTTGTLLFDLFDMDDGRIYPERERFPQIFNLLKTGQVFVGPGNIASAALLTLSSGDTISLFDTDIANVVNAQNFKVELKDSTNTGLEGPMFFERGCYAVITGTNPRGQVILTRDTDVRAVYGPKYYSQPGYRLWAKQRKQLYYNI